MMSYALPESMMAIDITRHGGPEVLQAIEMPLPKVQGEYLLVKVAAAGVNRPDVFQRQGSYPPPPDASPIPGLEIAGDVVAVGEDCKRRQVGDKVCALVAGGGYAEYCLVHDSIALPLENLSYTEAAAIPENFFTVWANVFQTGKLQSEESVLIHGGPVSAVWRSCWRKLLVPRYTPPSAAVKKQSLPGNWAPITSLITVKRILHRSFRN